MLRDEDGMTAVGRLAAVLVRLGWSHAVGEKILRMNSHGGHATQLDEGAIATAKAKPRAKRVAAYPIDALVDAHLLQA